MDTDVRLLLAITEDLSPSLASQLSKKFHSLENELRTTKRDLGLEYTRNLPMDTLRQLLGETEIVYIHGEQGEIIAMVLPRGGWWVDQLPEAPEDHLAHEHLFPWGEPKAE